MKEHVFLIEIGTDELPSKILKKLGIDFSKNIIYEFKKGNIRHNAINWFVAPRHLAIKTNILIEDEIILHMHSKNFSNRFNVNIDSLNHKINKTNLHVSGTDNIELDECNTKNLLKKNFINNKNFKNLLLKVIKNALGRLTNYKMMRWGNTDIPFIRPVNTITVLLDSYLVCGRFFEIDVDRVLYGHRYIENNRIVISHARDYPDILMTKGYVIVDYNMRKKIIQTAVEKQASKLGGVVIRDDKFLEEITALIEWPVVLFGRFNKKFLKLPSEIIIYIMKENQKYFPIYNIINGILLPCFIFVVNTITDNYKNIIIGHENIIKARFIDAEFFLNNDNRHHLEDYMPQLDSILFHRQLGSLREKVDRIIKLSSWIATQINADIPQVKRAAYLCKCDLMTDMVREFPLLQGVIGMHYARRDGESEEVAIAQKEHYQPKCVTDELPSGKISCIISIADKMDTISGIFGIKEFPTSSRDPFSLKRTTIGILNIIIQKKITLNLLDLIYESIKLYKFNSENTEIIGNDIRNFIFQCLHSYYFSKKYKTDIIKSVLNSNFPDIISCDSKIRSIDFFYKLHKKESIQLNSVYKRIINILKKQNLSFHQEIIQCSLLIKLEEKQLFDQIVEIEKKIESLFDKNSYDDALIEIVNLSKTADIFLDSVIIMDHDLSFRLNRLTLLNRVKDLILRVIDVSVLHV